MDFYGCDWQIDSKDLIIKEEIGRGSFGVVFKGRWRNIDVAIKKFKQNKTFEMVLINLNSYNMSNLHFVNHNEKMYH